MSFIVFDKQLWDLHFPLPERFSGTKDGARIRDFIAQVDAVLAFDKVKKGGSGKSSWNS